MRTYLGILQTGDIWIQIEFDALSCPRKCDTPDKEDSQHDKWEGCRDVHNLKEKNMWMQIKYKLIEVTGL